MLKSFSLAALCFALMRIDGQSQALPQKSNSPVKTLTTSANDSRARVDLWMGTTFWNVIKEGQVDFDSCLIYASPRLGISRNILVAEGIENQELQTHTHWIDERKPGEGKRILGSSAGKQRAEMLHLLGSYYAFQPNIYKQEDSAIYFLTRAIQVSKELKNEHLARQSLCVLGKAFFDKKDTQRGDSIFVKLIADCKASGDKRTQARAYEYWGIYPPFSPATTPARIERLESVAEIFHQLELFESEINALTDVAYLAVTTRQIEKSHSVILKALQLAQAAGYPNTHYITDLLAFITTAEGKFGEPLMYTLMSIKSAETSRDSIGWGYFYTRLSMMYGMDGSREQESRKWSKKALERHIIDRNAILYMPLYGEVARLRDEGRGQEAMDVLLRATERVKQGTFTESYFLSIAKAVAHSASRQFNLAEVQLRKADSLEDIAEKFRGPLRREHTYLEYGFLYFAKGDYTRAKVYFEKTLGNNFPGQNTAKTRILAMRNLIYIDSVMRDPVAGLNHYKAYAQMLYDNFQVSRVRQAEELQVMYQTQEKELQIATLNQKAELEQANLKQAVLVKNLTIAGIVASLIIAGLLYWQNLLKQKNNQAITIKNDQLQRLLSEKEWLLKEIHHRVKNNLQIVMSLLSSQSTYIDSQPALAAIKESQHRVQAMSLIHQKLYNSENVSSINISFYIREMVSYLSDSFDTGQRIRFDLNVESIEMDVSEAVPLGLILNEAITNSIKYAFPDDKDGIISISLVSTSEDHCILTMSDDGIGMPSEFEHGKVGSLGMTLMKGLSEDLDGKFSVEIRNGTVIKIIFVHNLNVRSCEDQTAPFSLK